MIYQRGLERGGLHDRLGEIRFQSRPDAIAGKLREANMSGALKPGDRLIERKLAARLGVGQRARRNSGANTTTSISTSRLTDLFSLETTPGRLRTVRPRRTADVNRVS